MERGKDGISIHISSCSSSSPTFSFCLQLHTSNQSVTHTVSRTGALLRSVTERMNPRPTTSPLHGWFHDMRVRTGLFFRAARIPTRFYFINIVGTAMIGGTVTSLAQRGVCGRTGSKEEVGNLKKLNQTKMSTTTMTTPTTPATSSSSRSLTPSITTRTEPISATTTSIETPLPESHQPDQGLNPHTEEERTKQQSDP